MKRRRGGKGREKHVPLLRGQGTGDGVAERHVPRFSRSVAPLAGSMRAPSRVFCSLVAMDPKSLSYHSVTAPQAVFTIAAVVAGFEMLLQDEERCTADPVGLESEPADLASSTPRASKRQRHPIVPILTTAGGLFTGACQPFTCCRL